MGHPKPFNMRLLGVGNEQWGPQYVERLERFTRALKARHPEVALVARAGPRPDDDLFQYLWPKLRELKADIVDEHCYATPDWFLNNTRRYDSYDRNGPKVFMGEYAAQSVKVVSPDNRNNLECALAEAAYMTGLERNAGVVAMSAYAPLFAHEEGWQWRPNLIWFDNLNVYGTPSYYVQKLFSLNRGDVVLPTTLAGTVPSASNQPRFYASTVRDEEAGEIIVKAVNATAEPVSAEIGIVGARYVAKEGRVNVLTSASLADENSILNPVKVAPTAGKFKADDSRIAYTFAPLSLTVLRLKAGAAK
jgi:alpha-N-arabinofuranosidase